MIVAVSSAAFAAGYQPPSLLPLIQKLKKSGDFVEKRVDPGSIERITLPPIHIKYVRGLTSKKHPRIVYNLRRIKTGSGGMRDTLYAILPDVTEQACASYKKAGHGTGRPYVVSARPVKIAPNMKIILEDDPPLPAGISCIKTPDDRMLFMMALTTRVKKPGQDEWQIQGN